MVKRRSRLLVSDEVQTSLLLRLTLHWFTFLTLNTLCLTAWIVFIDSPVTAAEEQAAAILRVIVPFLACSVLIVPIFMYDIAKLSNQFVGPVRRIRNNLQQLIDSGRFEPVRLRRGDYWQSLASELNTAIARSASPASELGGVAATGPQTTLAPSAAWAHPIPVSVTADFDGQSASFAGASAR